LGCDALPRSSLGRHGLFHWENPFDSGHYLFSVETSTPPGYFLPEEIAAGTLSVEDLVFAFEVPRCRKPLEVFDAMARGVGYCQRRLGGVITDRRGAPADFSAIRDHMTAVERQLNEAGLPPGSEGALRLF